MSLFHESSTQPSGRAVLLSIKPKYVDLILAGTKRIELRRSWPSNDVGAMVIYSSAPVQRLVGIAHINRIEECTPDQLWALSEAYGGGVTKEELDSYIKGKKVAYGVMLEHVRIASNRVDPNDIFPNFTPPQSFLYLSPTDFQRIESAMFPEGAT
jgi:predicted transcriptional regulator